MSCCSTVGYIAVLPIIYFALKFLHRRWKENKIKQMLERWNSTPKDLVILHMINRGKTCPSPSNYVLKLETYLRMTGIKYEVDTTDPWGPKGRFPWISLNGVHMGDTELIIEFLSKKFEKNLSKDIDQKMLASATMCRIMMEDHVFWGVVLERYVFRPHEYVDAHMNFSTYSFLAKRYLYREHKARAKGQGLGLHTESEITRLITKALKNCSIILGSNKFICGDKPTEQDCGIFALLALILWTLPNSSYEKLIKGELKNLEGYCNRMRETLFPDWDQLLHK